MDYVENAAENDYEIFDGTVEEAAYALFESYMSLPTEDKKRRTDVYAFSIMARRPQNETEKRIMEEEEENGLSVKVGEWFIPANDGSPADYEDGFAWVVKDGALVYLWFEEVDSGSFDWDYGGVQIHASVGGKHYTICAQVGINEPSFSYANEPLGRTPYRKD